ncbi:MAG: SpoIVB peptidase S55 [Acidobacteriales bacterium]|nr:SpoIVB peptidase S55 [Terriglobales bacterium]
MKFRAAAVSFTLLAFQSLCPAQPAKRVKPEIMALADVHRGQHGVAYTVFEGTKPEPMEVEVLGILRNFSGPKSDVILVRLHGTKPEFTGVVAGMSGSPVYIDGKLVGALAFRIGQFSKEPIAGITPIEEMLEINELDRSLTPSSSAKRTLPGSAIDSTATRTSVGGGKASEGDLANIAQAMTPIESPLVFNGFSEDTLQAFAKDFKQAGIVPVMGVGGYDPNTHTPDPIEPGSSVSAVMVRGDMSIASTCTVTYVDDEHLLACGHPLMQFGRVDMPMTKSEVIATLPSPLNAFKIVNATDEIGSFVQDRHTGILGKFGSASQMIPVTLAIHGGAHPKTFHYEVINNAKMTPVSMAATVYQALQGLNEYGEEISYRLNGDIKVSGFSPIRLENMFAPSDEGASSMEVSKSVGEHFARLFDNQLAEPEVSGVTLNIDLVPERKTARLEIARTDVAEARPGDEVTVEAVLRPYRGDAIVRRIPLRIPSSTPSGTLRILVSDSDTLDQKQKQAMAAQREKANLQTIIAQLNQEHANHDLYVSLLESNPQAMVDDKVMPSLPGSVLNVMDGLRSTKDMFISGDSAVYETSTPLDYVVTGSQVITIEVR